MKPTIRSLASLLLLPILLMACKDDGASSSGSSRPGPVGLKTVNAGTETQNGGYGVQLNNGQIVSLDLYLRRSHERPYLSEDQPNKLDAKQMETLHRHLDPIAGSTIVETVARKLSHAKEALESIRYPLNFDFMIHHVNEFHWIRMPDTECADVRDDDSPIKEKIQIAYRQGWYVRFCKDFERLDDSNKSALILHEIVYASLRKISATREFVGLVFNEDFKNRSSNTNEELKRISLRLAKDARSPVFAGTMEIQQVFSIEPSLQEALDTALGQKVCFGYGWNGRERAPALWGVSAGKKCVNETVRAPNLWILGTKYTQVIDSLEMPVGEINSSGDTLVSLCSKNYADVCKLSSESGQWRLIYGMPDAENISLLSAVRSGNEAEVQRLLALGADPNEIDNQSGKTLLITAYEKGYDGIFDRLVRAGANPNQNHGSILNYPLAFVAIWDFRSAPLVSLINSRNFDFSKTMNGSPGEYTLVLVAIDKENNFALQKLVEAGAEVNDTFGREGMTARIPLIDAVKKQNLRAVQSLLSSGKIRLDVVGDTNVGYSLHHCTALAQAVGMGNIPITQVLLSAKADPNVQCMHGGGKKEAASPLMLAVQAQSETLVDMLLAAGANPKAEDHYEKTALDYAREINPSETMRRIVKKLEDASRR